MIPENISNTASCGIEGSKVLPYKPLVEEAIELAEHKPQACVLFQREQLTAELNENMDLVKVLMSGERSAIIEYSDYRKFLLSYWEIYRELKLYPNQ